MKMNEQGGSIQTLNDLRLADERLKQIPLTKILRISLNSLRRQDSDVEVYEYMFTKALHNFDPDEFEKTVSEILLPELLAHLKKIAIELKDNALLCFLTDNLKTLLSIANVLSKFAEYVVGTSETYQLYKTVTVFLEFLMHSYGVIQEKITVIQQKTAEYDILKHLFSTCQSIQLSMTNLLAPSEDSAHYFQHTNLEEEYNCMKDVISMFCTIGFVTTTIDIKLSTEAWKAVVKLISRHAKHIEMNSTIWLHNHILTINKEIDTFPKFLLQHNNFTKNEMVKLKFKSLLLKVLLRLIPLINIDEFNAYDEILNTIVSIECTLSIKELSDDVTLAIRQYLKAGYMNVIGLVFKSSNFAKALTSLHYESTEQIAGFYEIVMHVILKLITDCRDIHTIEKYTVNTNLIRTCISYLSKSHDLFIQRHDIFRRLLVHLSAFVIMCVKFPSRKRQKLLEENLVEMILTDSYWVGIMGLDIWSVYLRYHSVELLWQYFMFWKIINDKFSAFSSRPRAVFVGRLLQNIYIFAPRNIQHKAWIEYSVLKTENYRLWLAVKLKTVDKKIADIAKEALLQRIQENLQNKNNLENLFNFLNEILLIHSLECGKLPEKFELILLTLWKSLALHNIDAATGSSIVCTLSNISMCSIRNSSFNAAFIKLLTDVLSDRIDCLTLVSKQHLLHLIEAMLPSDEAEKLLRLFADDTDLILRGMAAHMLQKSKGLRKPASIPSNAICPPVINRSKCRTIVHHCNFTKRALAINQHIDDKIDELFPDDDFLLTSELNDDEGRSDAKRPKLDNDGVTAENLIQKGIHIRASKSIEVINQQVQILQEISREGSMSMNQLNEIRNICAVLNSLSFR